jgi:hypothetical protein
VSIGMLRLKAGEVCGALEDLCWALDDLCGALDDLCGALDWGSGKRDIRFVGEALALYHDSCHQRGQCLTVVYSSRLFCFAFT